MIRLDHIGIAARDPLTSARALADILDLPEPTAEGADDDMYRVDLEHGASLFFSPVKTVDFTHIAFRVDPERFADIVRRLAQRGIPFGNDPEDTSNGKTADPLGGIGRVYFLDENGHLFEVVC